MTTGGEDAVECFLYGLGIDPAQFTSATGGGRVHIYQGTGGATLAGGVTSATAFWTADGGAPGTHPFMDYDMIFFGCEGATYPGEKPAASLAALESYANAGGRVIAVHDQYYWIESAPPPSAWPRTAVWNHTQDPTNQVDWPVQINTTFPRGIAMATWIAALDASADVDTIAVAEGHHDLDALGDAGSLLVPPVAWLSDPGIVEAYSFYTPITLKNGNNCGVVVFSDMHVAPGSTGGGVFPTNCAGGTASPQQHALEFLMLNAGPPCVQNGGPPPPPPWH